MNILIAEDDTRLLKSLKYILEKNDYIVDAVDNGTDAYDYILLGDYDGAVLDVMMPGKDGFQVLKEIREKGISIPVLFLTAKTQVEDRIEGLDLGADDYLTKPFNLDELLARVRAMLRRKDSFTPNTLDYGKLVLNCQSYEIQCEENKAILSGKELQILEMLIKNNGMIISSEQILSHIWGNNSDVDGSVIWAHISNIRKKLSMIGATEKIKFVRGAGYMITSDE